VVPVLSRGGGVGVEEEGLTVRPNTVSAAGVARPFEVLCKVCRRRRRRGHQAPTLVAADAGTAAASSSAAGFVASATALAAAATATVRRG